MNGQPISQKEIETIKKLRRTGHSLPEIRLLVKRGNSTVFKYIKSVRILPQYQKILSQKQGGSIRRSQQQWLGSEILAKRLLKKISVRDSYFILACLYWGEGNKRELNLMNSDPNLIGVFISCLQKIGVPLESLRISIRIYEGIDIAKAKKFWAKVCGIKPEAILSVNILQGKKAGKLRYGMCRVRVAKGGNTFKLIMSMIGCIKSQLIAAPVVQWIERGTPKP